MPKCWQELLVNFNKFFPNHAVARCPKFLNAAARKRLDHVSVPVWLIILSASTGCLLLGDMAVASSMIGSSRLQQKLQCRDLAVIAFLRMSTCVCTEMLETGGGVQLSR